MNENDIYDLQIKISHLEDFVNGLNSVILDQNEANDKMKREIKRLKDKISQLEERIENKSNLKADEPPPHY